eukprot:2967359-Prymnesium_polylepis.1
MVVPPACEAQVVAFHRREEIQRIRQLDCRLRCEGMCCHLFRCNIIGRQAALLAEEECQLEEGDRPVAGGGLAEARIQSGHDVAKACEVCAAQEPPKVFVTAVSHVEQSSEELPLVPPARVDEHVLVLRSLVRLPAPTPESLDAAEQPTRRFRRSRGRPRPLDAVLRSSFLAQPTAAEAVQLVQQLGRPQAVPKQVLALHHLD